MLCWDNLTGTYGSSGPFDVGYYWYNMLTDWGSFTDPVGGTYYKAGAGGLSYIFDFNENLTLGAISGYSHILNYFIHSISMTAMSLNVTNETQVMYYSSSWSSPTYATSISIPLYMAEGT